MIRTTLFIIIDKVVLLYIIIDIIALGW